jgi:hypothetical protein
VTLTYTRSSHLQRETKDEKGRSGMGEWGRAEREKVSKEEERGEE